MLKRKSLGPEMSNNHSLYPTALLVRLQGLRVEWLAGALAGGIMGSFNSVLWPLSLAQSSRAIRMDWATQQEQWVAQ